MKKKKYSSKGHDHTIDQKSGNEVEVRPEHHLTNKIQDITKGSLADPKPDQIGKAQASEAHILPDHLDVPAEFDKETPAGSPEALKTDSVDADDSYAAFEKNADKTNSFDTVDSMKEQYIQEKADAKTLKQAPRTSMFQQENDVEAADASDQTYDLGDALTDQQTEADSIVSTAYTASADNTPDQWNETIFDGTSAKKPSPESSAASMAEADESDLSASSSYDTIDAMNQQYSQQKADGKAVEHAAPSELFEKTKNLEASLNQEKCGYTTTQALDEQENEQHPLSKAKTTQTSVKTVFDNPHSLADKIDTKETHIDANDHNQKLTKAETADHKNQADSLKQDDGQKRVDTVFHHEHSDLQPIDTSEKVLDDFDLSQIDDKYAFEPDEEFQPDTTSAAGAKSSQQSVSALKAEQAGLSGYEKGKNKKIRHSANYSFAGKPANVESTQAEQVKADKSAALKAAAEAAVLAGSGAIAGGIQAKAARQSIPTLNVDHLPESKESVFTMNKDNKMNAEKSAAEAAEAAKQARDEAMEEYEANASRPVESEEINDLSKAHADDQVHETLSPDDEIVINADANAEAVKAEAVKAETAGVVDDMNPETVETVHTTEHKHGFIDFFRHPSVGITAAALALCLLGTTIGYSNHAGNLAKKLDNESRQLETATETVRQLSATNKTDKDKIALYQALNNGYANRIKGYESQLASADKATAAAEEKADQAQSDVEKAEAAQKAAENEAKQAQNEANSANSGTNSNTSANSAASNTNSNASANMSSNNTNKTNANSNISTNNSGNASDYNVVTGQAGNGSVSYQELLNHPSSYAGDQLTLNGTVLSVDKDGNILEYIVSLNNKDGDEILVVMPAKTNTSDTGSIQNGTKVSVEGQSVGLTTTDNNKETIPMVNADKVSAQK